jgi:hypothetical protein
MAAARKPRRAKAPTELAPVPEAAEAVDPPRARIAIASLEIEGDSESVANAVVDLFAALRNALRGRK